MNLEEIGIFKNRVVSKLIHDKNIVDSNLKPNVKYANDNDSELVTNTTLSVENNTITLAKSVIDGGEVVENSNSVNLVAGENVSITTEGDNVTIYIAETDVAGILGSVLNTIKTRQTPVVVNMGVNRNSWSYSGQEYEEKIKVGVLQNSNTSDINYQEEQTSTTHIATGEGLSGDIIYSGNQQYLQLSRKLLLEDVVGKTIQYKFNGEVHGLFGLYFVLPIIY